jgi:hypothetical protein
MAFDKSTRNRLSKFVTDCRALLSDEFTRQLKNDYGLDPDSGDVAAIESLAHLDDAGRETARILRETMGYYVAGSPSKPVAARKEALDRIVREQSFTVLNRLCALRMAEARKLFIDSIANGFQSQGFQLYARLAGPALGETGDVYRVYLQSVFDELAVNLGILFDRYSVEGRLFPRESVLLDVLDELNHADLADLWSEDETIGWIYQYWNSKEERKAMRDASAAPRNSRELAVRNQFFTPRYVVEFLTDNTLGRIWYEMTKGETRLAEQCRYLVRRPTEIFLADKESAPEREDDDNDAALSQEELLKQPVYVPHRPLKDPREIRLLDPACGSMHFGLYAFDLFEVIYEEAWEKGLCPDLQGAYAAKEDFQRDVPRLIIEHNIHGIDIDPRAVQIAGLSLWLRAQKSWQNTPAAKRPRVQRSNIVCAEPMPGSKAMLDEFVATLDPPLLGELVKTAFDRMKLAGEAGSLLKIEDEIRSAIEGAHQAWGKLQSRPPSLFSAEEVGRASGKAALTGFDKAIAAGSTPLTGDFWETAEQRVIDSLRSYAEQADADSYQRRLFADDAARGFAFIDLCRKRYDAVVMNPPFGEWSKNLKDYAKSEFPLGANDILAAFVERGGEILIPSGRLGSITSRTPLFLSSFTKWRNRILLDYFTPEVVADLGIGVMDDAVVEAAAYVLTKTQNHLVS